ncbi:hypothetical protein HJG60_010864 [Phyllostomus discolor]|uniref:Uncharacterized protein n=1 Tax=Phyllostomus discolor TaxID=89673 RepID=A0A834EAD2_9CHIR|nr:hypothetical protein HJG60_010864 [Phyllostomus discolor]
MPPRSPRPAVPCLLHGVEVSGSRPGLRHSVPEEKLLLSVILGCGSRYCAQWWAVCLGWLSGQGPNPSRDLALPGVLAPARPGPASSAAQWGNRDPTENPDSSCWRPGPPQANRRWAVAPQ